MSAGGFIDHTYDVIVVGAGGAGLRATLGLAQGGYFLRSETTLILKKHESALWNEPAALLKEVTDRQFRGGSQGVSIPIGGGARYHVGAVRNRAQA